MAAASKPSGVASSRMWPLSRTTRQAARRTRSATSTERIGSMGVQPVQRMTSAAAMAASGAEEVARHVQDGGAEVEVAAVAAGEDPEAEDVDHEAGGGDGEHDAAGDRLRVVEAMEGLEDDPDGDQEEREAVDEGGEDGEAVEAVGAPGVGGAAGEAEGEPGQREGGDVGEHVAGVGEKGERAGEEAAGDLDQHEAAGQERGDAYGAGAGGVRGGDGRGCRRRGRGVVAHRRARALRRRAPRSPAGRGRRRPRRPRR